MRRLQARSRELDAKIWIGKDGVSDELLSEVNLRLKARELVKLKAHKSALTNVEITMLAEKVAATTKSVLVEVMGHTFTLFKHREVAEKSKPVSKRN